MIQRRPGGLLHSTAIGHVPVLWAVYAGDLACWPRGVAKAGICQMQRSWVDLHS